MDIYALSGDPTRDTAKNEHHPSSSTPEMTVDSSAKLWEDHPNFIGNTVLCTLGQTPSAG
jgi:hypothetical protein